MGAATSERKITLPLDVDSTELRLWIFSCFNSWPSSGQELARLLFRVAARLHELTVEHQAAYPPPVEEGGAAPEPYAPPTPEEKNAMFAGADPAMSACRNGIISVITARCAKDKCASGAEKAAAKQSELQATASALLAALLEACSSDARFSHLKESPYIKEDRLAYNVITDDMVKNIWCIPGVRLLFDIIDTVTRQKLTVTTSVSALFDTPSVWLSLAEHRDKIGPPLRALGASRLPTASALITHLEALSIANFVTTCANGAELPQSYREAYQLGANDLSDILAKDPTPITVETMNKICEKIRRALEDRKLAPKPTPSAKLARFEPTKTGAPRQARESRGRGNGRRGRGGGSRGGDRRVDRDPNSIQCNVCAQFGHGWLVCPKGNKEMQKKEVARRAEQDARNASRALRRTEGKDEVVSEDEEQYEDGDETAASVNHEQYSVGSFSFFIPVPTCTHAEPVHCPPSYALDMARSLCTRKSTKIYPLPLVPPQHAPTPSPISEELWSVTRIVPPTRIPLLHPPDHITILSSTREALCSNNKLLTVRSPEHGDSIVHMYPVQCVLKSDAGAVIDTGAQRSAAKHSDEILQRTNTSHSMQGAFGQPAAYHNERYSDGMLNGGYSRNSSDPRNTRRISLRSPPF